MRSLKLKIFEAIFDETFQLPTEGEALLDKLVQNGVTFTKIKVTINNLRNKEKILLKNFQKENSILNKLKKLNKTELTIDGEVFSFKVLLAIKN